MVTITDVTAAVTAMLGTCGVRTMFTHDEIAELALFVHDHMPEAVSSLMSDFLATHNSEHIGSSKIADLLLDVLIATERVSS